MKTALTTLNLLGCQIDIPATTSVAARNRHLQRSAEKAHQWLTDNPADVLLLPELSTLEYSNETFAKLDEVAEDDDGMSFQTWRSIAINHQCWVLYGYARRHDKETGIPAYSIATGIINPNGMLHGVYEKLHLAQFGASEEKDYFNVSGNQLMVFECNGFRLAPIICYDIRFAELASALVLQHKVDCILHTGAYARDPSFDSWHAFVKTRAMENQAYIVSLNRAGSNFGNSVFMPPWVDEAHPATHFATTEEQCLLLTLDRSAIDHARHEYHFLEDRLPSYNLPVVSRKQE